MKENRLSFETIDWHDAIIQEICVKRLTSKKAILIIKCSIYFTESDQKRQNIKVIFKKIKNSAMNLDVSEIFNNKIAGNVESCYVYKNTYQFNMYGGFIEVKSKQTPIVEISLH